MLTSARRALRRSAGALLGMLFGSRLMVGRRRALPAPVDKILVIRIDERVGNILLTTPLIQALRESYPSADLTVLAAAGKAHILEGIVETIPFEKRNLWQRPIAFVRRMRELRAAGYDLVVDASHAHAFSLTSALLLAWTRAPMRITHARGAAYRFATDSVQVKDPSGIGEVATKLRLLAPLGIKPGNAPLKTNLGLTEPEDLAHWMNEVSPEDRLIAILPGARKHDHRADPALFGMLARLAQTHDLVPIIVWGPGEKSLAETIAQKFGGQVAPATDLSALAALLRRSRLAIVNDSGPMHLAVACGTPTLALFRGSDPGRWGHHRGAQHHLVDVDALSGEALDDALRTAFREAAAV